MKTLWDTRPQRIHENTRRSWRELDTGTRQRQICQLLADRGPMTDRQVQKALGFAEKNSVSPALTLLVKAGILAEAGKAVCDYTGRTVRTVGIPDDDGPTEIERYAQQQRERAERAEAECVANHQMYAELSASLAQMTMDRDQYIDCYAGQMKEANAAIAEVARLREGLEKILEGGVDYKSGPTSGYSYYNELSAIKVFAYNLLTQTNEASEPTPPPASTEEGADNEERE